MALAGQKCSFNFFKIKLPKIEINKIMANNTNPPNIPVAIKAIEIIVGIKIP
ncbi:hypothetical protein SDC9_209537 [bioreactor metagenome]|uniref:Uncharacterized protein n=1 Tax=bioreactor metagenome TaxID=1076179 RepID=A0A645JN87_9ZZZZ